MKGSKVFVEIDGEEIYACGSVLQGFRVLRYDIVVVLSGFGCQRPDLFIASSISRYEEDRDTFDLANVSVHGDAHSFSCITSGSSSNPPSR